MFGGRLQRACAFHCVIVKGLLAAHKGLFSSYAPHVLDLTPCVRDTFNGLLLCWLYISSRLVKPELSRNKKLMEAMIFKGHDPNPYPWSCYQLKSCLSLKNVRIYV